MDYSILNSVADLGMLSVDAVFQKAKHFGLMIADYKITLIGPKQQQTRVELLIANRATGECSVLMGTGQRGASFLPAQKVQQAFQAAM